MNDVQVVDHVLTLKVKVSVYAKTGVDVALCDAAKFIEGSEYDEGRYPFDREMIVHALGMLLRRAAFASVLRLMQTKYGNDVMVESGPNSRTNLAYLKSQEWMDNDLLGITVSDERWKASLDRLVGE